MFQAPIALLCSVLIAGGYLAACWILARKGALFVALTVAQPPALQHHRVALSTLYWLSPLFFLGLWGIASYTALVPARWLPGPTEVAAAGWDLLYSGTLFLEAAISLSRIIVGFLLAAAVGVSLGLVAGSFVLLRQLVLPINSFFRYVPPTAFIALLIVYFGVGEMYKYAVVFFGLVFFIVHMVIDIVDDIDARHVEMARTSGFTTWQIFRSVIIRCTLPRILDVLRVNLGAGWTFLVAAELIGSERGLGHLIAVSQRFLRLGDLYVGILTFGLIGLLSDQLLDRLGRRAFRWYYLTLGR